MENNTDYLLQYRKSFSDIVLSSAVLNIIGAVIGVTGNSAIIFFYFFRIKERGERYFIPLLGIVDLLGCLTNIPYYKFYDENMNIKPSTAACKITSFLWIFIPGISAHTILVISIQRYFLVCKPFGPKMTRFWKRVSFGVVCFISLAYSAPLLATAGVFTVNVTYRNHNITKEVCNFSDKKSNPMIIYHYLLFLIMAANLVITVCMYLPVMKQVKILFRSRTVKESKVAFETETSYVSCKSNMETDDTEKPSNSNKLKGIGITNDNKNVRFETSDISDEQVDATDVQNAVIDCMPHNVTAHQKPAKHNKKPKSKAGSGQEQVTIMFFYLIVTYVLSYTPPLIIWILLYTSDDIESSLTKPERTVLIFLSNLVLLNHVLNPFIYGYFDTKFKEQLRKLCQRKKYKLQS